jgi:hypothetical protein
MTWTTSCRRAGVETSPLRDRLLAVGFYLSLIPEVVLELVKDTAAWLEGEA